MSNTYPYNIAKGNNALANVSVDASYNIAFGYNAGSNLINGYNNTFIGNNTQINSSSNTFSNSTAIGSGAIIDASNQIMLGTALQNVVVPGTLTGFGVTLPSFKVSITSNSITSVSPYYYVPIPYNVVDYDYNLGGVSGSNYNISTYIYTVPLSGKYVFTYNYNITTTNVNSYGSFIAINNTTTASYPSDPSGGQLYLCDNNYDTTGTRYSQGSLSIRLNQNDKVNIFGYFKNFTSILFDNLAIFNIVLTKNTGGTITYTDSNGLNPRTYPYPNGYAVHTFTSSSSFVCNTSLTISYLVVGGGGGGGKNTAQTLGSGYYGGGGGAGGYLSSSTTINSGTFAIAVGNGGSTQSGRIGSGGSGGNSVIQGIATSIGGGGGGYSGSVNGGSGGSGGGAGTSSGTGGTGTPGQGYNGAAGVDANNGGGGGGAGGPASGATRGPGVSNSISGTSYLYCEGGGSGTGAVLNYGCGGAGQTSGGGAGQGIQGIVIIRYPYSLTTYGIPVNNWFTGEMVSY